MNTHNPVQCIKCDIQATCLVNELPYCAYHEAARAQWLLYHEGVVSKLYNELGFVYTNIRGYVPIKGGKHGHK